MMMFEIDEYYEDQYEGEYEEEYDEEYDEDYDEDYGYTGYDAPFITRRFEDSLGFHQGSTSGSSFQLRRSVSPHPATVIMKSPQTQALDYFKSDSEDSYDEEELLFYFDKTVEIKDKSLKVKVKQGDSEAAFQIGQKYSALKSMHKAIGWYKLAASNHHTQALIAIGDHYCAKLTKNHIYTAIEWYTKAYENQHMEAAFKIGMAYKKLNKSSENQTLAMEWFLKSFTAGNGAAALEIGIMYLDGHGVPRDDRIGMEWFLKADEAGDAVAAKEIANLYSEGLGVKRSRRTALEWYMKAHERGDIDAAYAIGRLYEDQKIKHDKGNKEALKWYYRAAIHNHNLASEGIVTLKNRGYQLSTKKIASIIVERDTNAMEKKYTNEINALKMALNNKTKQIETLSLQLVDQNILSNPQ